MSEDGAKPGQPDLYKMFGAITALKKRESITFSNARSKLDGRKADRYSGPRLPGH